jgi:hypothetical protein
MLYSLGCALPFALAAGLTFSASAQAPPADRPSAQVWSVRDGALHAQHELAPSPEIELLPADIDARSSRSGSERGQLMLFQPHAAHNELIDDHAVTPADTGSEMELAEVFGR